MNSLMDNKKVGIILLLLGLLFYSGALFAQISSNVSGKVLDEETGLPVNGVKVLLKYGYKWTKTDERGEYVFQEVKPGLNYIAFFPPPPYAWGNWKNELQSITIERGKNLYLITKLKIGGILKLNACNKTTGLPIKGVDVHIRGINFRLMEENYETDENGIYTMGQLTADKYVIDLRKEGWWQKTLATVEILENKTTTTNVRYDPEGIKIEGFIKCSGTGQPLADMEVYVEREGKYGWALTSIDQNGHFSMLDMEEGTFKICVSRIVDVNGKTDTVPICKTYRIIKNDTNRIYFPLDCSGNYAKRRTE